MRECKTVAAIVDGRCQVGNISDSGHDHSKGEIDRIGLSRFTADVVRAVPFSIRAASSKDVWQCHSKVKENGQNNKG